MNVAKTLPDAPRASPMDAPPLGWGILGPGKIAERFTTSLRRHTRQRLAAVGSRRLATSREFAERHGVAAAYGSYEEMVADPALDVVYIATPNHLHLQHALLALRAGKHVLVEKPFATSAADAQVLTREAERRGLFAMEGMWPRFQPVMAVARQAVRDGLIGRPLTLTAELADLNTIEVDPAMYDPAGGGVISDRGIYLAALSSSILGAATTVEVRGHRAPGGASAHLNITIGAEGGAVAQLLASMWVHAPSNARILGTEGALVFDPPWFLSPRLTLFDSRGAVLDSFESDLRSDLDALCFEAAELARCVTAGLTSSPVMPTLETVQIISTLDAMQDALDMQVNMS